MQRLPLDTILELDRQLPASQLPRAPRLRRAERLRLVEVGVPTDDTLFRQRYGIERPH